MKNPNQIDYICLSSELGLTLTEQNKSMVFLNQILAFKLMCRTSDGACNDTEKNEPP